MPCGWNSWLWQPQVTQRSQRMIYEVARYSFVHSLNTRPSASFSSSQVGHFVFVVCLVTLSRMKKIEPWNPWEVFESTYIGIYVHLLKVVDVPRYFVRYTKRLYPIWLCTWVSYFGPVAFLSHSFQLRDQHNSRPDLFEMKFSSFALGNRKERLFQGRSEEGSRIYTRTISFLVLLMNC